MDIRNYSIFLETDHLFNEATALIPKSNEKKEHLQVLEERLQITDNVTYQTADYKGRQIFGC